MQLHGRGPPGSEDGQARGRGHYRHVRLFRRAAHPRGPRPGLHGGGLRDGPSRPPDQPRALPVPLGQRRSRWQGPDLRRNHADRGDRRRGRRPAGGTRPRAPSHRLRSDVTVSEGQPQDLHPVERGPRSARRGRPRHHPPARSRPGDLRRRAALGRRLLDPRAPTPLPDPSRRGVRRGGALLLSRRSRDLRGGLVQRVAPHPRDRSPRRARGGSGRGSPAHSRRRDVARGGGTGFGPPRRARARARAILFGRAHDRHDPRRRTGLLSLVSLLACAIPAARAARMDPQRALRADE